MIVLFTGALFIQQSLGWDLYLSIFALIAIVTLLTLTGGLTAVMYTDTLQALLMVVGAMALTLMSFAQVGWFDGLWSKYPHAVPNATVTNLLYRNMSMAGDVMSGNISYGTDVSNITCTGKVNPNWDVMLRSADDPDFPWPGFLLGQTPGSIWYWCTDQVIVQRALAGRGITHVQGATILAGYLKILPFFIIVIPGMISRVLFPNEVACVDPDVCWEVCQSRAGCSNIAYPKLVLGIMPNGLRGLMMAVMIAAIMSDLDSIFNSASSIFTIDIWRRIRKKATIKEEMIVGRLFLLVMAAISIALIPVVKEMNSGQTFVYMAETANYFGPQAAAVYLLAILWPRCNEKGAFWGLISGIVVGAVRLVLIFVYQAPGPCSGEEDPRPAILKNFHHMYFAFFLFMLTLIMTMIISLLTQPPKYSNLYRTTFWTRYDDFDRKLVDSDGIKVEWGKLSCCFNIRIMQGSDTKVTSGANGTLPGGDEIELAEQEDHLMHEEKPRDTENGHITCGNGDVSNHMNGDVMVHSPETLAGKVSRILLSWFCGITGENQSLTEQVEDDAVGKIILQQSRATKLLMNVMLAIILLVGTFLFCFWSLWKYTPDV